MALHRRSRQSRWSLKYIEWLKVLTFEADYLRESFDLLIELYEYLTGQIVRINRKVVMLCHDKKYHDRVKLLCTAPGIGKLTAIEILVELQDMSRFVPGFTYIPKVSFFSHPMAGPAVPPLASQRNRVQSQS